METPAPASSHSGLRRPEQSTRLPRSFAFMDLCSFTDFVDLHGDESGVAELRLLRSTVREIAPLFGVRVDKWLGDGVMLVGVEAEPLLGAAIAIAETFHQNARLPLRAGIASGRVIMLEGADYVGLAVNLAARLCDLAKPYELLAAVDGLALPPGSAAVGERTVVLQGFTRPVSVATVVQRGAD